MANHRGVSIGERVREYWLDAVDWVDIRRDPHWLIYALPAAVIAMSATWLPLAFLVFIVFAGGAVAAIGTILLAMLFSLGAMARAAIQAACDAEWKWCRPRPASSGYPPEAEASGYRETGVVRSAM